MVLQAELISKGYHSLVPGLISMFRDHMGPLNKGYKRQKKVTKFQLIISLINTGARGVNTNFVDTHFSLQYFPATLKNVSQK